ncbi:SDR family NAD(P)-dependent oxidoreductase [Paenibacillus filicis]|uniref:SDR family NAD(P)-dependent oxidoreductase n=1 Tax=Paenibacillus gyeongsangnamensis TaxID=3388067 RepID=A0ABT4QK20_9BACL|nr:SDR family oxidoreductase [Paenibacillus filicis]MCZ8517223.1 SDR family NAD(P)-dependent oxidoreductase [Paenibacillus filicis]
MDIRDKVVLITGASAGIGLATARRFAAAGAKLALVARSADVLNHLAEELKIRGSDAVAMPADVSDPKQVQRVIDETARHFGRLDVVINNVGQAAVGTIADLNRDDFRKIFDLNVIGPLAAMQAVIPIMREQGGGLIINISSVVTKMNIPGIGAYAATKAALNMLSDTARGELASEHIRVISVYPRATATDFGKNALGVRQQQPQGSSNPSDTPEFVAEKILAAALNEPDEQYMDK